MEEEVKPAFEYKDLNIINHKICNDKIIRLKQFQSNDGGVTTGYTLWLSGQVLAAYLGYNEIKNKRKKNNMKCIELGSGIGFVSYVVQNSYSTSK